jgi:hypothetical protein
VTIDQCQIDINIEAPRGGRWYSMGLHGCASGLPRRAWPAGAGNASASASRFGPTVTKADEILDFGEGFVVSEEFLA